MYLIQVAIGAALRGNSIGRPLDIVKRVFSDVDL